MPPTLTFLAWVRERVGELVGGIEHGRARAATDVTLTGRTAAGAVTSTQTRQVKFLLAGPQDVTGVKPRAISGRYPAPGAIDARSDNCPYVELRDPSLPWRYTPAANPPAGAGALHPWLVLVVGVDGQELTLAGHEVALGVDVQKQHPIGNPSQASIWAHVQETGGQRRARLLSGRRLAKDTDYVAVLVPAYRGNDNSFTKAWFGTDAVTVPVYDSWRFHTAAGGSFRELAKRLKPGSAAPGTGGAATDYPRLAGGPELVARGALAPVGSAEAPLPAAVAADMTALIAPATDEVGRPVMGLPRYGDAWKADPASTTTWGATLNRDPRHRGAAGLGLELGIRLQDELADEASARAGALEVAAQRIRHLVLGMQAAGSLWRRRLPTDPARQFWLLGPALRRVVTDDGPVADLATADDRPLPPGVFSTAARRILRPGPARTTLSGGADPAVVLPIINKCPDPPPEPGGEGLPKLPEDFDRRLGELQRAGSIDTGTVTQRMQQLGKGLDAMPDPQNVLDVIKSLAEPPEKPKPCTPIDPGPVIVVFDPTGPDAPATTQVLSTIQGVDPPLAPPEVCVGLDRPVWRDLNEHFSEWLLPGVGNLPDDSVIALESNPVFTDAFLAGYNTQVVSELRWRNLRIATNCTPLKVFWERAHTGTGARIDDIVGLETWPDTSDLGTPSHRPGGAAAHDLVLAFRGQLFLRFPKTAFYLVSAVHAGKVDFSKDPASAAPKILPSFQGRIGADVMFFGFQGFPATDVVKHWVALEEPPAGFRFWNLNGYTPTGDDTDGARFADHAFGDAVRVLIRGDHLAPPV
jgi:hypothetical protein